MDTRSQLKIPTSNLNLGLNALGIVVNLRRARKQYKRGRQKRMMLSLFAAGYQYGIVITIVNQRVYQAQRALALAKALGMDGVPGDPFGGRSEGLSGEPAPEPVDDLWGEAGGSHRGMPLPGDLMQRLVQLADEESASPNVGTDGTPRVLDALAGDLLIHSLPDEDLLKAARDETSPEHKALFEALGPETNPFWITCRCAEVAYERKLIDECELDLIMDVG